MERYTNPYSGMSPARLQHEKCYLFYNPDANPISYPLKHLDDIAQTRIITGIHGGVRISAAVVLGTLLLLLARTYKSVMFGMYELNFLLMIISAALQLSWTFSFNASTTQFLTNGDIPFSDLQLSVASSVFQVMLIMSLLATLVIQIYMACGDLKRPLRIVITTVGMISCFPCYFIWLWRLVLVGINDLGEQHGQASYGAIEYAWVYKGAWASFAASTSACSLILCIKLWLVHRRRASMGVEHFDPVRILLAMAAQNSGIPAILAIVSAAIPQDSFGGQSVSASTIPITAVLLPTGYIMAQYNMLKGTSRQEHVAQKIVIDTSNKGMSNYTQSTFTETPYSETTSFKETY